MHNTFGAEVPKDLFHEIFEARRQTMIAANQWPKDKPLPDPEQFLTRELLESTLKDMGYVPTKLDAPADLTAAPARMDGQASGAAASIRPKPHRRERQTRSAPCPQAGRADVATWS